MLQFFRFFFLPHALVLYAFVGLCLPTALSANALDINSLILTPMLSRHARIPAGVIQTLETPIEMQMQSTQSPLGRAVHLILTTTETIHATSRHTSQAFPLALTSQGLKLGLTGTVTLSSAQATRVQTTTSHLTPLTHPQEGEAVLLTLPASANSQTIQVTMRLWPVLFCDNPLGCAFPEQPIHISSVYAALVDSTGQSIALSEPLLIGGTLRVRSGCTFALWPTDFADIELTPVQKGAFLATRTSNISVRCARPARVHVTLSPAQGIIPNEASQRIATTNRSGIGLLYDTSTTPATTLAACQAWHTDNTLGDTTSESTLDSAIHWHFYQYQEVPQTGPLRSTVQYEFWVD